MKYFKLCLLMLVFLTVNPLTSFAEDWDFYPSQENYEIDNSFYNIQPDFRPQEDLAKKFEKDFSVRYDWIRLKWKLNSIETKCPVGDSSDFRVKLETDENFKTTTVVLFTFEW